MGAGKERPTARRPATGIQPPDAAAGQQDQPHCQRDDRRGGGLWDSGAGRPYERRQHRGRRGAGCPDPEPHRDPGGPDRRQPGRLRSGGSGGGTDPRLAESGHGAGRDPGRKGAAADPGAGAGLRRRRHRLHAGGTGSGPGDGHRPQPCPGCAGWKERRADRRTHRSKSGRERCPERGGRRDSLLMERG
ncbi:hypothetical protein B5F28_12315 [Gemmiger sp. An194]|nr:hypothetical protein B5F28_12315 [Gemmiger sp. An194]